MTWFYATSVSVTNGQTVVSVNTGDDIVIAQEQGGLIIGSNPPVEIKRTYLDGSSNKKIELSKAWPYGTQTNQPAVAFPTDGDLAAATAVLKTLIDGFSLATQADALAGTDNVKSMTALRVAQAFQQYGLGVGAVDLPNFTSATANTGRFFRFLSSAVGKPSFATGGTVVALPYSSTPATDFLGVGVRADSSKAAFLGYKSGASGTPAWIELWDKGKNPAQSTLTDTTAGALLTVGSFGWGTTGTPPTLGPIGATVDTLTIPTGVYRVISNDTGNKPFGNTDYTFFDVKYNSGAGSRVAFGVGGEMYSLGYSGGVQNSNGWRRQYDSQNAITAIAWDGARNTGGLLEYGSNANGAYYKYADGRLECFHNRSGVAMSANVDDVFAWTFPAAFIAAPAYVTTNITGASGSNSFNINKTTAASATTTSATMRASVNYAQSHSLVYCAIGRWR